MKQLRQAVPCVCGAAQCVCYRCVIVLKNYTSIQLSNVEPYVAKQLHSTDRSVKMAVLFKLKCFFIVLLATLMLNQNNNFVFGYGLGSCPKYNLMKNFNITRVSRRIFVFDLSEVCRMFVNGYVVRFRYILV